MSRPPRPTSSSRSRCSGGVFDWEPALRRLDELDARAEDPTLWEKPEDAQTLMRERQRLSDQVEAVRGMERDLTDAVGYAELADAEDDEASLEDARAQLKAIRDRAARAELEALLSGEADANDAYVEINSGAGGTEWPDWAAMLLRMYSRWAQAHGMSAEVIEETPGEQAGIKSATLHVKGTNAYGWLKTEAGVHRLVRISPYRFQRPAPHLVRLGLGLSGDRRHHRDRDQSRRTCAPTPTAPAAPAASTSTRPIPPCA